MLFFLKKQWQGLFGTSATRPYASKKNSLRPEFETLEDRNLMSFGPEFTIGAAVQSDREVSTASSANGMSVAVWTRVFDDGTDTDIRAQLFNADGTERGDFIRVTAGATKEHHPTVAMDSQGNFVVAWVQDLVAQTEIWAQRFAADGAARGGVVLVTGSAKNEFDPSVAMDAAGNFVVSWTLEFSATDLDVRARLFNSNGTAVADSFGVATSGSANEVASSVARTDDGRFAIAFQTGNNIKLKQFSATGALVGSEITIAATARSERNPSLAMDALGNMVVAWEDALDIKARRVASDGTRGDVLTIRNTTAGELNPSVALERTGRAFSVAYERVITDGVTARHVEVAQVFRNGATDQVQTSQGLGLGLSGPAISVNGNGFYFVGYQDFIDAQVRGRFGQIGDLTPTRDSSFNIEVSFGAGLTNSQRAIFEQAAQRWEQVILGDLPNANFNGQVVDDVLIAASGVAIDGNGGILGQATFDASRNGSLLPFHGFMEFDTADLARMETDGQLLNVILHEMGHVLGIGTLWDDLGLVTGLGTADPQYTGVQGVAAYNSVRIGGNISPASSVPVEDVGGPGSIGSHWRESVFDNELMTSLTEFPGTPMPLSRLTLGSLADMGYQVNRNAADSYSVPLVLLTTTITVTIGGGTGSLVEATGESRPGKDHSSSHQNHSQGTPMSPPRKCQDNLVPGDLLTGKKQSTSQALLEDLLLSRSAQHADSWWAQVFEGLVNPQAESQGSPGKQ